jgi:hypothetical protein
MDWRSILLAISTLCSLRMGGMLSVSYLIPCSSYENAKAELENMLTPHKTGEEKKSEVEKLLEEKGFSINESGSHCLWATKKTFF